LDRSPWLMPISFAAADWVSLRCLIKRWSLMTMVDLQ
jgi:hypothetical protein